MAVNAIERLTVIEKMLSLGLITVEQAMEMETTLQGLIQGQLSSTEQAFLNALNKAKVQFDFL